jgi:hypothetical protein
MICPVCHGQHLIRVNGQLQPCPECGGFGEWNCCEGLQEQPPLDQTTTCPVSASTASSCSLKTEPPPGIPTSPPSRAQARNPSP